MVRETMWAKKTLRVCAGAGMAALFVATCLSLSNSSNNADAATFPPATQRRNDQCVAPTLQDNHDVFRRSRRLTLGKPTCEQIENANNTARVAKIIGGEDGWDFLFPVRHGGATDVDVRPYTYENFLTAVTQWPEFCGDNVGPYFVDQSPEEVCKRELASLFGMMVQEVGAHDDDMPDDVPKWRQGLYRVSEQGCTPGTCLYGLCEGWQGEAWPCTAGKAYYGRGPYSLTWNYNYGLFSKAMFGETRVLLEEPDLLLNDGWLAFASAIWFHMTPQPPRPSSHDIISGHFVPNEADIAAGRLPGFGAQIMAINGGLECGRIDPNGNAASRIDFFSEFAAQFEVAPGANLNCSEMQPFDSSASTGAIPVFWDRDWSTDCGCKLVPWQTTHAIFDFPDDLDRSYCGCLAQHFSTEQCPALAHFAEQPWDSEGTGDEEVCDFDALLPKYKNCVADAFAHQAVTDEQCRPCGGSATPQTWWPCDVQGLCYCDFFELDPEPTPTPHEPYHACKGSCGAELCLARLCRLASLGDSVDLVDWSVS